MAKLIATLREQVRSYLDESSASDWTTGEVDREINVCYHAVYGAAVEVFEDYYLTTTQFNVVANKQEYGSAEGFPSDFFKLRRVEINYNVPDTNSVAQRALPVQLDEVRRDLGNATLGISTLRNPGYYLYGTGSSAKIGFLPIPTIAGTNGIKLWYVKVLSDLSDSNTTVDIPYPDRFSWIISLGAAANLLRKGQQEEVAARAYREEFALEMEKMKQSLEDRVAEESKHAIDVLGEDLDFGNYSSL